MRTFKWKKTANSKDTNLPEPTDVAPQIIARAKQVSEVMGHSYRRYIDICKNTDITVNDIIENLLAEKSIRKAKKSNNSKIQKRTDRPVGSSPVLQSPLQKVVQLQPISIVEVKNEEKPMNQSYMIIKEEEKAVEKNQNLI
jgi:hypothetical protein